MTVKTVLTFKDGQTATFAQGDPLELDLDRDTAQDLFSVVISVEGKVIFSAYHWHNAPAGFNFVGH